ncbi:MAG: Gfo/Idh/MocA family oxidoreductase, partial [Flavobacteriales bacterium]
MTNQGKVKFAVVGCGHIGKRHAEMIQRHPECELVALCDSRLKEDLGVERLDAPFFNSMDAMLAAVPGIEVVNICTPNGLHAEMSLKALEALKHVVCEKPMALTKASCEAVLFKALQVQRTVFGVMQNRYSPPSQWIKSVVDQGLLGDIFMVQVNCYWNRDARYYKTGSWKGSADLDGGTLFTQFSHFIDIMFWLFGDITDIQGKFADFAHQDLT